MTLAMICAGLIAAAPAADTPSLPSVAQTYQEARAQAGRSPEEQVKLALWCEAHGLTAERLHHLTLAVLADPRNAAARGLMGLVAYNGRWLRPEILAEKLKADQEHEAALKEYAERRLKAAYTADGQWTLGVWCDEHGLKDQARAHLTAVTRLDPSHENAWKRLGFKKHEGRWVSEGQLAAEKAEADAQKAADKKWKPLLEKYKAMLDQPSKRAEAEAALAEITDRAVPSIGRVFAVAEATQARAVQLLGQIDAASASKALAFLAVFGKSAEARRSATETLRGRDPREYADLLIALIGDPIKYEVRPVGGPGSPGVLYVEGPKANVQRLYSPPSAFRPGDTIMIGPSGLPVVGRSFVFENDRPNVTGHSRYTLVGSGYADTSGIYLDSNTATAARNQYLGASYGGVGASASFTPSPTFLNFLRQGRAAGNPVAGALGHLPIPPAQPHQSAAQVMMPQEAALLGFQSLFNAPYLSVQSEVEIPLAQVVAESQKTAMAAQEQLKADTKILEEYNGTIRRRNDLIVGALNTATGQKLAPDRRQWTKWWVDQLGYALVTGQTPTKPTIVEEVPLAYQPQLTPIDGFTRVVAYQRMSCFGAGTPVRTIDGVRPIESLKVGDQVLTQSTATGALGYRPILVVHHNPPSATFRIQLKGEAIISSHFHRFWLAGRGWVMARDLKPGDPVRTLGGIAPVESVEPDKVQLVYNLDVADDADFFAGQLGALVHDNTLPDPRLAPFDAATAPAKAN